MVLGAELAAGSVAGSGTGLAPGLVLGPGAVPESVASTVELSPAVLLAWAEAEPAGARSAALLDGVDPAGLDPGGSGAAGGGLSSVGGARGGPPVGRDGRPGAEHRGAAGRHGHASTGIGAGYPATEPAPASTSRPSSDRSRTKAARPVMIEIAYTALLVLVFVAVVWFTVYVVYKLYQGPR